MEELNVNQEMENVAEEVVVPNGRSLMAIGISAVVVGAVGYGVYKGIKFIKDRKTKRIETKAEEDNVETTESEVSDMLDA